MLAAVARRSAVRAVARRNGACRRTYATTRSVPLYIDGQEMQSASSEYVELLNPATQEVLAHVPLATRAELERAVASAQDAYPVWRNTPVPERMRVMLRLQALIKENHEALAHNVVEEHGKTLADARGDVQRGVEVVEHACSVGTLLMGETLGDVSNSIDTYSYQAPLGVCAAVLPFNFPAMLPLWCMPLATVAGNTFVCKPSEKDPGAALMLAKLATEAGMPPGVFNIVHGTKDAVDFVCDAPDIKAVSFVGSNTVGEYIHARASKNLKRVQSNMAAKNHAIVLPDAHKERTLDALVGASFGAAGQRCMALTTAVFVGDAQAWIDDIVPRADRLVVSAGITEGADLGPLVDVASKQRVEALIDSAAAEGATLLRDGRGLKVPDFPKGNFVGPTLIDNVTADMRCYQEEIFGPVLLCVRADTLDDAIAFVNRNRYGNGAACFTASGAAARHFQRNIEASQVGINLPIPVPVPFFSFTGGKDSFVGRNHFMGKDGIRFYTQTKTITSNWSTDFIPSGLQGIGAS